MKHGRIYIWNLYDFFIFISISFKCVHKDVSDQHIRMISERS